MSRLTAAQKREIAAARAQKIEEARKRLCHRSIVTNIFPLITGGEGAAWAEPIPFDDIALPTFPVTVFPEWLRDYTNEMATALQVPVDLMGALGLGMVAAACMKRVYVIVQKGWREPLNLYIAATLPSGEGKTPAFRAATQPIRDYQDQQRDGIRDEIRGASLRQDILRAQKKLLVRQTTKQDASAADAAQKVQDVDAELHALVVPPTPRLISNDITTAALAIVLSENGERIAILSDEAGLFEALGTANQSGLDIWLKTHDGADVYVDRVSRPSIHLREPLITAVVTPQPYVLEGLAQRAALRGRGFLPRFLFIVPKSLVGYRVGDAPPARDEVVAAYHARMTALLGQAPGPDLTLSDGARGRFVAFKEHNEVQLQPYGPMAEMADWTSKLPGATARLAALLHMADHAGGRTPFEISRETMARGIEVATYLIPHAQAAFRLMGADEAIIRARWVLGYLVKTGAPEFSLRDLCRALSRKVD